VNGLVALGSLPVLLGALLRRLVGHLVRLGLHDGALVLSLGDPAKDHVTRDAEQERARLQQGALAAVGLNEDLLHQVFLLVGGGDTESCDERTNVRYVPGADLRQGRQRLRTGLAVVSETFLVLRPHAFKWEFAAQNRL